MRSPQEIASSLSMLADLMDINGENEFKIRAHRVAADICSSFTSGTETLLAQIASPGIPKIGDNLAKKIQALAEAADIEELRELSRSVPLSVLELRRVPGLGPKKVKTLWQELRLANLEALEAACHSGLLKDLKGFGEKQQIKILEGIEQLKRYKGKMLLSRAIALFELEAAVIKQNYPDAQFSATGQLRRSCEVLSSADIILTQIDLAELAEFNRRSGLFVEVKEEADKIEMHTQRSEIVRIYAVSQESFGKALLESTGSEEFNAWFQTRRQGRLAGSGDSEEDIFAKTGVDFIYPEQREPELSSVWDSKEAANSRLIQLSDMRGIIHCHSTYSDGADELKAMAVAAKEQGFGYLGIADHSISAKYAGGLTVDRIKKQHEEIDKLNEELAPFRILKGIESDITPDGNLDYDNSVLEKFDFVVASVHNGFNLSREEMTARIIRALRNPFTSILGHPTGRLLLEREPYAVDLDQVVRVAAEEGVVIEINANSHRLDLDWRWIPFALSCGARFSIDPDAHRIAGFSDIRHGVAMARKGGLSAKDVVTCFEVGEFLGALRFRAE